MSSFDSIHRGKSFEITTNCTSSTLSPRVRVESLQLATILVLLDSLTLGVESVSYFIQNTSKVSHICVLCICEYTYHIIWSVYKQVYIYINKWMYSFILFKLLFPSFWQSFQCEFFSCQSRDSRPAAGSARDVCSVLLAKLPLISSWCEKIRVSWTWLAMGRAARELLYY